MQKLADVVLDRRGNVVPGATVRVKKADGTLATLYATNALTAPINNPLTTDSLGRFGFYAVNGRYKLEVYIGAALQTIQDDVLLEDPLDETPEIIDGGIVKHVDLQDVTIDGLPPFKAADMSALIEEAIDTALEGVYAGIPVAYPMVLTEGQTVVNLPEAITTTGMSLVVEGSVEFDYTITGLNQITLPGNYSRAGRRIWICKGIPQGSIGDVFATKVALNQAVANAFAWIADYDAPGLLTLSDDRKMLSKDGVYWRPLAVNAPFVKTGNWAADKLLLVPADGAALLQMMNAPGGADLSAWQRAAMTSTAGLRTVLDALSALPITPWEFKDTVTVKDDPANPDTWDWKPAIDAMYAACGNNYPQGGLRYGKRAMFPGGRFGVSGTVGPTRLGINTVGEGSLTSVIYARPEFVGEAVFRARHPSGAALGGISIFGLGIDCNNMPARGLDIQDAYDAVIVDDVRVSKGHGDYITVYIGPRTDAVPGQPLSQTISIRGLFAYKNGGGATVPTVYIKKVQETQLIGCKAWAGGYGGTARGNTSAYYIEDSRSILMLGCSAVGAQNYGIEVRAQTKSTDSIFIGGGMLYENCNGTMKTSSADAALYPLKTVVHQLPRIEAPSSGGFDLGGLYGARIDAGVSTGTIQVDCDQCQVNAQHLPNWTDLTAGTSKRNIIDTYPNAIANYKAFSKEIAVVAPLSTPRNTLRRGDSTDYIGFEWSSSSAAENGGRLFINYGGTQYNVFRFDHTRTFAGPGVDNTYSSGHASFRHTVVYASTGTINTSDGREKTAVRELTAFELAAAKALGKEIGIYKWLQAVQEKGDAARSHVGMTVQRAIQIMQDNDLDPFAYGFICYDEWDATPEMHNDEGEVIEPAREAGNRFSFRMDELYAFIAAGFEARLAALESA